MPTTKSTQKVSMAATMLRTLGLFEVRENFLAENYGVTGLRDMNDRQLDDLINRLRADCAARLDAKTTVTATTRKLRSTVLTILTSMGRGPERGWKHVNEYLSDKRIAGKVLYELDDAELTALSKKLRVIARSAAKKKADIERQTRWN